MTPVSIVTIPFGDLFSGRGLSLRTLSVGLIVLSSILTTRGAASFQDEKSVDKQEVIEPDSAPVAKPDSVTSPDKSSGAKGANQDPSEPAPSTSERPEETERQKEKRLAVEREMKERGVTIKPLKVKLQEHARTPDRTLDLTFDDLVFDMKKGDDFKRTMLTKEIVQLHKKRISIKGYIRPSSRQRGITKFVFVRDNLECCFGPGAALFDCVLVKLAKGVETEYTVRPVKIEGDFYMKEYKGPDGKVWAVYRMKNGQIK